MERYPVAYVRRSYADATSTGDVSREVQEQAIRDLAHRDGHNGDVEWFVDWGKSASEAKSKARTRYADMVKAIEEGRVSAVYAYALDRLNRSLIMSARFAKACEKHDVRIVTHREGEVRQDSPAEWLRWTILATFGEYELRTITLRNQTANAERKAKGGWVGNVGYGYKLERNADGVVVRVPDPNQPLEPIFDAVREAGSIMGAAKLLQRQGIPSPTGKAIWGNTTLGRIIADNAPELMPSAGPTGRRQPSRSSMFAQLLLCHCGHVLTPEPGRKAYRCRMGVRMGRDDHGPTQVTERKLLPWMKAEAARLRIPGDAVAMEGIEARQDAIRARLDRAKRLYIEGDIDQGTYDAEKAKVERELDDLRGMSTMAMIAPTVDWDAPTGVINAALRAMWRGVQLGRDMRPVSADWIVEEWRRA